MSITVKITEQFKSIGECEFTLPDFCVITGKNGSGKTHLLIAMASALHNSAIDAFKNGTAEFPNVPFIEFGKLNPSIEVNGHKINEQSFITKALKSIPQFKSAPLQIEKNYYDFLSYVQKQMNLENPSEIKEEDLKKYFDVRFLENRDIFSRNLASTFKNYECLREQNLYNRFRQEHGQKIEENAKVMSNDEFVAHYGMPPWDLANDILKSVNVPYFFNSPEGDSRDSAFVLKLCDVNNKDLCINVLDLSTGEKVLISLAMAIYNSDFDRKKPNVLFLDEPDAGLHPSMSKSMVGIIKEYIVEKLRVPVIITTHSPTTIAALSGIEIYEKVRGIDVPRKVTKEEALSSLTSDIPFLTVSMESRRAIFVESQYDADIFSELCEIFKGLIEVEPHFFPLYKDKNKGSNCEDVINSANHFLRCGDIRVYGIVDWDGIESRVTQNNLLVLGNNERYSIENYLLDPLLVGIFLILTRNAKFSDYGIKRFSKYLDVPNINQDEAQLIIDNVLIDLGFSEDKKRDYLIHNGWVLQTASSILLMQGHALEDLYKIKYPCLNQYNTDSQKKKNLKFQIVDTVLNPCSGFFSRSVVETLQSIR